MQNLRSFTRLDEAELKEVDVHEGIESTIRLLSQYFNGTGISLRRHYGDLPRITCFAGQLNQVWMNLLVNAAQAIGDAWGEVSVKTSRQEEGITVSVSDTGSGISSQNLNRIFDPFFTTKAVGEGTGLGLSISHGIVARHGGRLTVTSVVGQGTTFDVLLPLHPQASDEVEGGILDALQDPDS